MNCGYKEKTILYFYGELPEGAAAEVKAHIGACGLCAGELAILKSLAEGFDAFKPRVPALSAEALVLAARGEPLLERLMAGFRRAAVAGAFTAMFLLTFQAAGFRNGATTPLSGLAAASSASAAWKTDIDAGLDNVEYGIYSLQDDMTSSSAADFDYGCADIENQKEEAAKKTA
jgi:anti-sigma factor RsiW